MTQLKLLPTVTLKVIFTVDLMPQSFQPGGYRVRHRHNYRNQALILSYGSLKVILDVSQYLLSNPYRICTLATMNKSIMLLTKGISFNKTVLLS